MALYTPSGNPTNASRGLASVLRAEFALIAAGINAVAAEVLTLTNKTINLGSNTLTGTKAQFNTACSDGNFLFDAGGGTTGSGALVFGTGPTLSNPVFLGTPSGTVTPGTYTPTASNQAGGAASAFISGDATYFRSGNMCMVFGALSLDFMANSASSFEIDLPFTPVVFSGGDLYGGVVSGSNALATTFVVGTVLPVAAGTTVRISTPALNSATQYYNFSFMFVIA